MISAKIIEDSISVHKIRLTTLQLCYPRFIHSEFMTHRVFSRNASSSRAIPVTKVIDQVRSNPAVPIHYGKNQAGMQAVEELDTKNKQLVHRAWINAATAASNYAEFMTYCGAHKQLVNRILEPFQYIHVIVTATEFDNFFALRLHPDAQPEIYELAKQMKLAMENSTPYVQQGWHLPYCTPQEKQTLSTETLLKISAARCARVSYLTHDGATPDIHKDLALYDRLVGSKPLHASPIEHQAIAADPDTWSNNFRGWTQYRYLVEKNHT